MYMLAIYAVLFLVLWFLFIRPASKRNREMRQDQSTAAVGSHVMLTSGIFGTVSAIDEDAAKIHVDIAPGVTIQVARVAIATVTPAAADTDEASDAAATEPVASTDDAVETD